MLTNLENHRAVFSRVGRDHVIRNKDAAIGIHESFGFFEQVMTKGVVGGEGHPAFTLDHIFTLQVATNRAHIHRVIGFRMEQIAAAILATQFVRVTARLKEHLLRARCNL